MRVTHTLMRCSHCVFKGGTVFVQRKVRQILTRCRTDIDVCSTNRGHGFVSICTYVYRERENKGGREREY
jgi:hypothetical protein